MSHAIPLELFPNVVTEILLRLKIKDAMSTNLCTATPATTLRIIQHYMRDKRVSGIPIVTDKRIVGLVSVDDIINALDYGHIDEPAEKHMTKKIVALEDDMPLSFAISYFNKYSFGRFPVINKDQEFVGILTSRDILARLVEEMNIEISQLEEKINPEKEESSNMEKEIFPIKNFDFENAGKASHTIKKILQENDLNNKIIRRAAIASYELEINIAIHSQGGQLEFEINDHEIIITARDKGPGIEDTSTVVQEGFSTANDWIRSLGFGAGMGLPNVKKVSDRFSIESKVPDGTVVTSVILLNSQDRSEA